MQIIIFANLYKEKTDFDVFATANNISIRAKDDVFVVHSIQKAKFSVSGVTLAPVVINATVSTLCEAVRIINHQSDDKLISATLLLSKQTLPLDNLPRCVRELFSKIPNLFTGTLFVIDHETDAEEAKSLQPDDLPF